MGKNIVLLGTLDTKGEEYEFLRRLIEAQGHRAILVDASCKVPALGFRVDVPCDEVARAGGLDFGEVQAGDRRAATAGMARAAAAAISQLYQNGQLDGILAMGGSNGTAIASEAMRALPVGVPKVLISTMASGNVRPYIGNKDIATIFSVADICLNKVTKRIYANAVGAVIGMTSVDVPMDGHPSRLIGISVFGVTQPCVSEVKERLEKTGFEVMLFHSVGTGGEALEELVEQGLIDGVVDVTTSELVDEVAGGVFTAGPRRLEAAGRKGIPQVVVPGAIDLVNFWSSAVPDRHRGRRFYRFNSQITLMRSNNAENQAVGRMMAEKLNRASGPVAVIVPTAGFSDLDRADGPHTVDFGGSTSALWFDSAADQAFVEGLRGNLRGDWVEQVPVHINDPVFADRLVERFLDLMGRG
ncbi:MAG: Tm-1-like ATP-binding domain-containing protein [Chloroflexi bacterium]|nr:Tm-1-like ATP-binding domain-containing protein [Chloroflexota bacterium]